MDTLKKNNNQKIVLFSLDEPRYALYLSEVVRAVRAVEITPLPKAPGIVSGVINFHGEIIPVIDIRKLFRLPQRDMRLDDQFIIARTQDRLVVLMVDAVNGVYALDHYQVKDAEENFPYTQYLSGIANIENAIVLINDLNKFLSLDEEQALEKALAGVDQ